MTNDCGLNCTDLLMSNNITKTCTISKYLFAWLLMYQQFALLAWTIHPNDVNDLSRMNLLKYNLTFSGNTLLLSFLIFNEPFVPHDFVAQIVRGHMNPESLWSLGFKFMHSPIVM